MPITAIAPPVDNIDTLASGLSSYLNRDQVNGIRRAYYYACLLYTSDAADE